MATLTITTPAGQDARILAAVGRYLNLGGDASAAQDKQVVITLLTQLVQEMERRAARDAADAGVSPVTPT